MRAASAKASAAKAVIGVRRHAARAREAAWGEGAPQAKRASRGAGDPDDHEMERAISRGSSPGGPRRVHLNKPNRTSVVGAIPSLGPRGDGYASNEVTSGPLD